MYLRYEELKENQEIDLVKQIIVHTLNNKSKMK